MKDIAIYNFIFLIIFIILDIVSSINKLRKLIVE